MYVVKQFSLKTSRPLNVFCFPVAVSGASSFAATLAFSDTGSVGSMRQMFENAKSFTGKGLASFDVSGVMNMRRMFAGASSLNNVGDIAQWDVGNVESMNEMVCKTLT